MNPSKRAFKWSEFSVSVSVGGLVHVIVIPIRQWVQDCEATGPEEAVCLPGSNLWGDAGDAPCPEAVQM